jgi:hypothetical protein
VRAYARPEIGWDEPVLEGASQGTDESDGASEKAEDDDDADGFGTVWFPGKIDTRPGDHFTRQQSGNSKEDDEASVTKLPWSEKELLNVFRKFSDSEDREVGTDNLLSLLRYLGARPHEADVKHLVSKQTKYSSILRHFSKLPIVEAPAHIIHCLISTLPSSVTSIW